MNDTPSAGADRRTVLRTAFWAAPAVTLVTAAPAVAATGPVLYGMFFDGLALTYDAGTTTYHLSWTAARVVTAYTGMSNWRIDLEFSNNSQGAHDATLVSTTGVGYVDPAPSTGSKFTLYAPVMVNGPYEMTFAIDNVVRGAQDETALMFTSYAYVFMASDPTAGGTTLMFDRYFHPFPA